MVDPEVRAAAAPVGCPAVLLRAERGMLDEPAGPTAAQRADQPPSMVSEGP